MKDYDKEIELRKKLGARKFQKLVFKVEKIKFDIIRFLFPNIRLHYEKWLDDRRDKALNKAVSDTEKEKIINRFRNQKLKIRKEFNNEKNLNYHLDMNTTEETLRYLKWNKNIHVQGMKIDGLFLLGSLVLLPFFPLTAIFAICGGLIGLFINFQCVNLQQYNICRIEKTFSLMKKREEKKLKQNVKNYSKAAQVISRSMKQTKEIPAMEDVIDSLQTSEEAKELRKLIQKQLQANTQGNNMVHKLINRENYE